jgi:hypothetical protein
MNRGMPQLPAVQCAFARVRYRKASRMRTGPPARILVSLFGATVAAALFAAACSPGDDSSVHGADAQTTQQALGGQPGGGIEGILRASYPAVGAALIPLPGADVWAQNVITGVNSPHVTSDYNGHYYVSRAPGNYKICWSKPGFTSACSAAIFNISNVDVGASYITVAVSTAKVLRGHVQLTDLSQCLNEDALFGVKQAALAEMLDASSSTLKSTVPNIQGDFVLPWDAAATQLRITCQQASLLFVLSSAQFDSTGATVAQFTIPNARPRINPISATASGADARQGVAPGTVVSLATTVTDPNPRDVLKFHWKAPANAGTLVDSAALSTTWTLPAVPGTYSAYFSADDQRGGFVTRRVEVTVTLSNTVTMSGTVHDNQKNPISNATITSGDRTTTSDSLGNFSLTVPRASSYLLNIEKMGYAELSRRSTRAPFGQEYILSDSFKMTIDPTVANVITDQRPVWLKGGRRYQRIGGTVTLPANSLDLTPPPVGPLAAYITTIDPVGEDMTGDMGAVDSLGNSAYLVTYGAVAIEIRDSIGTKYNLAAGKSATVDVPVQPPIQAAGNLPATIATWTFDLPSGNWIQLPVSGTLIGNVYRFTVTHFSTKNADIEKTNPACVRINLDPALPRPIKAFINLEVSPSAPRRREADLADDANVIYNLPPTTPYTLEIYDASDVLLNTLTGTTPAPWGGTGIPPASAVCDVKNLDGPTLGIPGVPTAYSRFLSFKGLDDSSSGPPIATAYYGAIDPLGLRTNLKAFFQKNGFGNDGSGGTRTTFINNGDLGFGRDMHCLQTGSDVACYVSNYGQPDQNPGNFTAALAANKPDVSKTVAMEYSVIEGDPDPTSRAVKFYVFDGACTDVLPGCGSVNSPRNVSANLDGAGEKYVPKLCNVCHGGSYVPAVSSNPTLTEVKMGASFLPFDIASYRDGTAGPKPSDPAFGTANILSQEAGFYAQNQIVLQTHPAQPIQDLIGLFYPSGVPPFDANATPCGWRQNTAGMCGGTFSGGTGDAATETLYRNVIAKACRSCHIAQTSNITWDTYKKLALEQSFTGISGAVCNSGVMPHSYIAFRNFWRSTSPHQPDTLASFSQGAINADSPAWTAIGSCVLP